MDMIEVIVCGLHRAEMSRVLREAESVHGQRFASADAAETAIAAMPESCRRYCRIAEWHPNVTHCPFWIQNGSPVFMFERPDVIDGPGQYVTRSGETVVISEIGRTYHEFFECKGTYPEGIAESWNTKGRIWRHTECRNDIVKKVWGA